MSSKHLATICKSNTLPSSRISLLLQEERRVDSKPFTTTIYSNPEAILFSNYIRLPALHIPQLHLLHIQAFWLPAIRLWKAWRRFMSRNNNGSVGLGP